MKGRDADSPGYETTDVNINGVIVFLAGLGGFLVVFFVFCFVMGKVINGAIQKADGPNNKWSQTTAFERTGKKREDMAPAPEMEQRQLQQLTSTFPTPRLDTDDGEQSTADLHAREDLLLNYYSVSKQENGKIRIPITRAMELIAQRGLPVITGERPAQVMVGDNRPVILAPLTTGFARTGYELDTLKARAEKMAYGRAESEAKGEAH